MRSWISHLLPEVSHHQRGRRGHLDLRLFSQRGGEAQLREALRSGEYEEVLAACAPSKIPQLYVTPQVVVLAPGAQESPIRGKDQLEQNELSRVVHRGFREHPFHKLR